MWSGGWRRGAGDLLHVRPHVPQVFIPPSLGLLGGSGSGQLMPLRHDLLSLSRDGSHMSEDGRRSGSARQQLPLGRSTTCILD